jgi:hypothetical protein
VDARWSEIIDAHQMWIESRLKRCPTLIITEKTQDNFESIITKLMGSHGLAGQMAQGALSLSHPRPNMDKPVIASVSLGAPRRFRLQHKKHKRESVGIDLEPGSVLVMSGDTQRYWRHQLPKTRRPVGPRINITFRRVVTAPEAPAPRNT